ncbi:MAG: SDR family oxidoreductase [Lentisphaeria bacterium]|nr:SDR family oxidoreductase [Lentisphaeria bacterium]
MPDCNANSGARRVLLTGATGLVGGYLLDRLCHRPDLDVHVLVRPRPGQSVRGRLRVLGAYFGDPDRFAHVGAHEGDVSLPGLGLGASSTKLLTEGITDVIHAAASISFEDSDRNHRTNEKGVRHVLASIPRSARFFHVSTAYVGGLASQFLETELDVGQSFRNDYERSKFQVERFVREWYADTPERLTVVRPSIVIGEQDNGRTFQFFTLYKVLRMMVAFSRRHPGEPFALAYDPDATQNYIPVDRLSEMFGEIFSDPGFHGHTYHLVDENPIKNRDFGVLLEEQLGCRIVNRAPDESSRALNRVSVESTAGYLAYLHGEPRFDCSARNQLGSARSPIRFDRRYLEALLDFCEQTAWGKRLAISR